MSPDHDDIGIDSVQTLAESICGLLWRLPQLMTYVRSALDPRATPFPMIVIERLAGTMNLAEAIIDMDSRRLDSRRQADCFHGLDLTT